VEACPGCPDKTAYTELSKPFLIATLVVLVELFLCAALLFLKNYPSLNGSSLGNVVFPIRNYMLFSFLLFAFVRFSGAFSVRQRVDMSYLLLHVLSLCAYLLFAWWIAHNSPLPFDSHHPILNLVRRVKGDVDDLTVVFGPPSMLLVACLHLGLFLGLVAGRRVYVRYLFCAVAAFSIGAVYAVIKIYLWRYLSYSVAKLVYLLLAASRLNPVFEYSSSDPVIGTHSFSVQIIYHCSGLEGIFMFLVGFAAMLLIHQKPISGNRTLAAGCLGVLSMFLVNVLRIYVLVLIGHFDSQKLAIDLWHSLGSVILYALAVFVVIALSLRFISRPSPLVLPPSLKEHGSF
jgi:exosortase/archaeosortase family protein